MARVPNYERQVYAGVLGKVIGVYMGRPFEGWTKEALERKWGRVDRYMHEDQNVPLVVPDDDITGTFTFVRALEDSGRYAETPASFFGETWLNYLIEGKTVLWWGGMGHSTEHTAFLRLKHGVPSPESGSMNLNGAIVSEQIGAQIFIDAFGLVTPGNPALAAKLAQAAARVSHDGEAVHAAMVVAGMVSAAFVEKDMMSLLDIGVSFIPARSLVARLHRDVRTWARRDGDWRRTYDRISSKYGYERFGGNCHVIPNHALMVMAWTYAGDDFHGSQVIVNTAGWDTDCNAGNVGCLMGVKEGLDRICEKYDFRTPFADRLILPTAEGTHSMSDCLSQAEALAKIGRRIMGWRSLEARKAGAFLHFEMPGAVQGCTSEEDDFSCRDHAQVENVRGYSVLGKRSLKISFQTGPGIRARVIRPVMPPVARQGGYGSMGVSMLYSGMDVRAAGFCGRVGPETQLRLFVRVVKGEKFETMFSQFVFLSKGAAFDIRWTLPDTGGWPVGDMGLEMQSPARAGGEIYLDGIWIDGCPDVSFPLEVFRPIQGSIPGWISHYDLLRGRFPNESEDLLRFGKNEGLGVCVTGTSDWRDYILQGRIKVHLASRAGFLARYQGLRRYLAVAKTPASIQLILRNHGEEVLDEMVCHWKPDSLHDVRVELKGQNVRVYLDDEAILNGKDTSLGCGGAGIFFEEGMLGFRDLKVSSL